MKHQKLWAYVALVGAILCFSGNYMLGGLAVASMPLMSLMFVKWGSAAIPMLLFANYIEKPNWKEVLRSWKKIAVLSSLGIAGYSFMLYHALSTTTAINASLINAFNPALIALASAFFLREKLTSQKIIGIGIAFAGVLYVVSGGSPNVLLEQSFTPGDLWMFGVIAVWAAYMIVIKKGTDIPPMTNAALQMTLFTLVMLPYSFINGITFPESPAALWSLAYIAIFPSAVAYGLWNYGSKYIEPSVAGQTLNLTVPFTAIMTLMSGGEITHVNIIGGILVLFGVYITLLTSRVKSSLNQAVKTA